MDLCRELGALIQRAGRGYADSDIWSLDHYLSEWLPKALRQLADEVHGCSEELYDETRKDDECWRWREILLIMAEGFEAKNRILNDYPELTDMDCIVLKSKWEEGTKLFIRYFDCLWD